MIFVELFKGFWTYYIRNFGTSKKIYPTKC